MDINLIRAAYPNPKAVRDSSINYRQDYCCGGALCLYYELMGDYGDDGRFPDKEMLAAILREANPLLDKEMALSYAFDLISSNDEGLFEQAWRTADAAVNYHPEETD